MTRDAFSSNRKAYLNGRYYKRCRRRSHQPLQLTTKFSSTLIGFNISRDAIVFIGGETSSNLSSHNDDPEDSVDSVKDEFIFYLRILRYLSLSKLSRNWI